MRMHVLRHFPLAAERQIVRWAASKGMDATVVDVFNGDALPDASAVQWLTVLGGPMSIHDEAEFPWLADEKQLLRACLDNDTMILGVCLGAQLLADALGGTVAPSPEPEIGWHPVTVTPDGDGHPLLAGLPDTFMAFHWHVDACTLPPGATHLLASEGCEIQAFCHGNRAVGWQFHPEMDPTLLDEGLAYAREVGVLTLTGTYVQSPEAILAGQHCETLEQTLHRLLDNLLERSTHE